MDVKVTGGKGYALLDSGDGRKLERFGNYVLDRPSPGAIWRQAAGDAWDRTDAYFLRKENGGGSWEVRNAKLPESWEVDWHELQFEVRLTSFGNVGLFPEHSAHWRWMQDLLQSKRSPKVLNLFAYTGGASLAAARAGADVTHVDAARSVNSWAKQNMDRSEMAGGVRFITEDALKFVRREQRRGRKYDGLIVDPPTFGRGAKGEVWKVERDFVVLMEECAKIMSDRPLLGLFTSHSPGITPVVLQGLLRPLSDRIEAGEMLLEAGESGVHLPAGCYARFSG